MMGVKEGSLSNESLPFIYGLGLATPFFLNKEQKESTLVAKAQASPVNKGKIIDSLDRDVLAQYLRVPIRLTGQLIIDATLSMSITSCLSPSILGTLLLSKDSIFFSHTRSLSLSPCL
jgi:hypothetical protein